jgi:hypothetical protein
VSNYDHIGFPHFSIRYYSTEADKLFKKIIKESGARVHYRHSERVQSVEGFRMEWEFYAILNERNYKLIKPFIEETSRTFYLTVRESPENRYKDHLTWTKNYLERYCIVDGDFCSLPVDFNSCRDAQYYLDDMKGWLKNPEIKKYKLYKPDYVK